LQAILLNLIVNAMEAMEDNMRPRAAPEIRRREGVNAVMDTGPGIDSKN
jgi:C4-dicarboxylate-specific signal transduction histidine kinase